MGPHPREIIAGAAADADDAFEVAVAEALERRTAEHAAASTQTAAFDRPLHDAERTLLGFLAARTIAEQIGCSLDEAFDALSAAAGEGQVVLAGDAADVRVSVRGKVVVHAGRDWLAFRSQWPGDDPWQDRR